jgi:hypothetical protein
MFDTEVTTTISDDGRAETFEEFGEDLLREHELAEALASVERDQARLWLKMGKTCRAAAVAARLVRRDPANENLNLLADVYWEQGLHHDAVGLWLRVVASETGAWAVPCDLKGVETKAPATRRLR